MPVACITALMQAKVDLSVPPCEKWVVIVYMIWGLLVLTSPACCGMSTIWGGRQRQALPGPGCGADGWPVVTLLGVLMYVWGKRQYECLWRGLCVLFPKTRSRTWSNGQGKVSEA